jgi:redox-regulated HSP33 family molecular chaperone
MTNAASSAASLLRRRLLQRDRIVRSAASPLVRLVLVQSSAAARDARASWAVADARVARLLGRAVAAAALLSGLLDGEERAAVRFEGASPAAPVSALAAEALALGEVRASVAGSLAPPRRDGVVRAGRLLGAREQCEEESEEEERAARQAASAAGRTPAPEDASSLLRLPSPSPLHWDGLLPLSGSVTVSRVLYNRAAAVSSTARIVCGDVAGDLEHLFAASSEPETALALEAEADEERGAASAGAFCGGALVQRIAAGGGRTPHAGHGWASFEEVARRLRSLQLGELAARGVPLEETARLLLLAEGGATGESLGAAPLLAPSVPLDFFCRCTKPALLAALRRAGGDALVRDLLREHASAASQSLAAAVAAVAAARFGGLREVEVVTTLTCGGCNKRHYVARSDLEGGEGRADLR